MQTALHAVQSGKLGDGKDRFRVSPEALKEHLRTVLGRTGAELGEMFLGA